MNDDEILARLDEMHHAKYWRMREHHDPIAAAVATVIGEKEVIFAVAEGGRNWMDYLKPEGRAICRLLGLPVM